MACEGSLESKGFNYLQQKAVHAVYFISRIHVCSCWLGKSTTVPWQVIPDWKLRHMSCFSKYRILGTWKAEVCHQTCDCAIKQMWLLSNRCDCHETWDCHQADVTVICTMWLSSSKCDCHQTYVTVIKQMWLWLCCCDYITVIWKYSIHFVVCNMYVSFFLVKKCGCIVWICCNARSLQQHTVVFLK